MRLNELIFRPEDLVPKEFFQKSILRDLFREKTTEVYRRSINIFEQAKGEMGSIESLLAALQKRTREAEPKRFVVAERFVEENYPHVAKRLEGLRMNFGSERDTTIEVAFNQAYDVLYRIAQMAWGRNIRLEEPFTFGTPDNGVQYEWRQGERQFHLEIIPSKGEVRYGYLLWPSLSLEEGEEGEFAGSLNESPVIKTFLRWVEKGLL